MSRKLIANIARRDAALKLIASNASPGVLPSNSCGKYGKRFVSGGRAASQRRPKVPAPQRGAPRGNQRLRDAGGGPREDRLRARRSQKVPGSGEYLKQNIV